MCVRRSKKRGDVGKAEQKKAMRVRLNQPRQHMKARRIGRLRSPSREKERERAEVCGGGRGHLRSDRFLVLGCTGAGPAPHLLPSHEVLSRKGGWGATLPTLARRHRAPAEIGGSGIGRTVGRPCSLPVRNARIPESRCKATWRRELKLQWREAGPPKHHDDEVDSDQ